jgi:pectinesterase inhibitor-like protein
LIYATKIEANPKSLAHAALDVTLAAAQRTSRMMKKLTRTHFLRAKEASAMADCMEVLGDSVDELKQSLDEMDHVKSSNFGMTMSDIETWVSAALTDEDSCMDGFSGVEMNGELKSVVGRYIVKVAHLSSNALALVNKYAASTN